MSRKTSIYQPEYFAKVEPLFKALLRKVGEAAGHRYIPTYFNRYRPLDGKPSPFPKFSWGTADSQIDYSQAFGFGDLATVDLRAIPEADNVLDYIRNDAYLSGYYTARDVDGIEASDITRWRVYALVPVQDLVDRYVRIHSSFDYTRDRFIPIYELVAKGIFEPTLEVEILIPILFVDTDTDYLEISELISIERISDDIHMARKYHEDHSHIVNSVVADYASCAFKLRGRSIPNKNWAYPALFLFDLLAQWWIAVDLLFAALRIVTGVETGYAQAVALPVGWAGHYTADLFPVQVAYRRAYPPQFDDGYWRNESFPSVSTAELGRLRTVAEGLFFLKEPRLRLATRRLNSCYLRNEPEDVVIDGMIGLETLLLADARDELTHRLATRYAALAQLSQLPPDPVIEYRKMKKLYQVRSTIVHGSDKPVDDETVKNVKDSLRLALGLLVENPEFLECKKIDEDLILARIAGKDLV